MRCMWVSISLRQFGCLYFGAISDQAALTYCIQISEWPFVSFLWKMQEIARSYVNVYITKGVQGGAQFKDSEGQSPAKCTATLWYREISLTHDSLRERTGLSEIMPQTVHQDAIP